MRINHLSKIAIAGATASLCLATAAPALAHDSGSTTDPTKTTTTPTLAQQQTWIDAYVAKEQQRLTDWAAKVAADPKLTAAQKADWAAKIAKKQDALAALKSAVDAATTTDELRAAVKTAAQADGVHGFGGWCGFWGAGHWWHHQDPGAKQKAKAPSHTTTAVKKTQSDPGKAAQSGNHTVTLRAQRQTMHPQVQGSNSQGKHWDGQSRSGGSDYQGRHGFGGSGHSSGSGGSGHNGGSHHR